MKKILVIQQKMIGDVLLTSILCEWLKKQNPQSEIHYCIYEHTYPVVAHNPFVDHFLLFTEKHRKSKVALFHFLKTVRSQHYDVVIDAYGKLESNLITLFSGASERISYDKGYSNFYYTKTVKRSPKVYTNAGNAVEDRLRLIVPEEAIAQNILKPKIYLTEEEKEQAHALLEEAGIDFTEPIIMIGVLGSSEDKSLPPEYMATLIDTVASETQGQLLYNYMPNQKAEALAIFNRLTPETKARSFFNTYGKGLREFLALLSHCDMLIGNEGGAVNMAKALEVPTFTLFSPWIHKKAWNLFEDGTKNVSVHLSDFEPEMYKEVSMKEIKKSALEWYRKFTPNYWLPPLKEFIAQQQTD